MNNTALWAGKNFFISDAHEKFYYEKLELVRYKDVCHKALIYCLGIKKRYNRKAGIKILKKNTLLSIISI